MGRRLGNCKAQDSVEEGHCCSPMPHRGQIGLTMMMTHNAPYRVNFSIAYVSEHAISFKG